MNLRPVLSALTRHKTPACLLMAQVALTLAVLTNSSFILTDYVRRVAIQSGISDRDVGVLKLMPCPRCDTAETTARVTTYLQGLSSVSGVSLTNTVPFGPREADLGVRLLRDAKKDTAGAHVFTFGPGAFQTLGLELIEGRKPGADDFVESGTSLPKSGVVYLTGAMARRLWPDTSALGKALFVRDTPFTVVGVVKHLLRPEFELQSSNQADWSIAVPMATGAGLHGNYVFRVPAEKMQDTMAQIRSGFAGANPGLAIDIQNTRSVNALRGTYLSGDRSIMWMLGSILFLTLMTTMLGIAGLTSFWVRRRRRQIGVRRALGATRADIASYFLTENGLIMLVGCFLGFVLSYAGNSVLMRHYALDRLPFLYLPVSLVFMVLVGQLAALGPALTGARVEPVEAIRQS